MPKRKNHTLSEDEAPPPNKRIHRPTEEDKEAILREKHILYKRLLETTHLTVPNSMLPLGLKRVSPVSPVYYSYLQQQQQLQASDASLLGTSETGPGSAHSSAILNISRLPGGSSVGSVSPPNPLQMLAASFFNYPFPTPTPSSLSNLSLLSPWSNGNIAAPDVSKPMSQRRPPEDSSTSDDSQPKSAAHSTTGLWSKTTASTSSILGTLSGSILNQPCFLPGQSPLGYFQNSPMSPMMLLNSPYAQSLSSIPSVGSSSGYSSSSDGPPNQKQFSNYLGHLTDRPSSGVSSMSSSVSSRDLTPEPDHLKLTPAGSDTFLISSRLSLSYDLKYRVGLSEIKRRLSYPEHLNCTAMGGILRKAKYKNSGPMLRQRLESIGVSLPPGRRNAADLSLFTSLVEGEALHLAKDFHRLCDNYFPHNELAQIIASRHAGTPEAQQRISMVKATQLILQELQAMVNAVDGQSGISPLDHNNPYCGLVTFSHVTHEFGNPAINACLSITQTYLEDLLSYYKDSRTVQPDPSDRHSDDKIDV